MTDPSALAQPYFSPSAARSFWQWAEGTQVVAWADGATLAFRGEVEAVVSRLAPRGVPPFDAIVLLLAACRPDWPEHHRVCFAGIQSFLDTADSVSRERWSAILERLDGVRRLSLEHRTGAAAKALLAETVFELVPPSRTPEESEEIRKGLLRGFTPQAPDPPLDAEGFFSPSYIRFIDGIDALHAGLGGAEISDEALALRARTGLSRLPEAASIEAPVCDKVRQLIQVLRSDRDLAGLARLALDLMAIVYLPHAVSDRDDLPTGGVSDISNRGPLDRLLISELAHDDLTFAARIALGEALFLRREQPPHHPAGTRMVLVDAGIRLWGVPRLFATAVALALAATADARTRVLAFRARGADVEPVDLTTREGLVAHLEALEPEPHPGKALEGFLEACGGEEGPTAAILVTHEDVLHDPDFSTRVSVLGDHGFHAATVASDGTYRLRAFSLAGRKMLGEARLDLKDIAPDPAGRPDAGLIDAKVNPDLPVFHSLEPSPLPQPVPPVGTVACSVFDAKYGMVLLTKDGRLLHRGAGKTGGMTELTARVPDGQARWLSTIVDGRACLVVDAERRGKIHLRRIDLNTGQCLGLPDLDAGGEPVRGIFRVGDALALALDGEVVVADMAGSSRPVVATTPGLTWQSGRYFRGTDDWYAMAFDGTRVRFEPLRRRDPEEFVLVFDRQGLDGPWVVTRRGHVVSLVDGSKVPLPRAAACNFATPVSADGHRIRVRGPHGHGRMYEYIADVRTGNLIIDASVPDGWETLGDASLQVRRNVARLYGVDVTESGDLQIVSGRHRCSGLRIEVANDVIVLRSRDYMPRTALFRSFKSVEGPTGTRFSVRMAAWADGSRAYVDSRGLLHLASGDPQIPECTLLLVDHGQTAGWASNGELHGPDRLLGDRISTPAPAFFKHIRRFAGRLR